MFAGKFISPAGSELCGFGFDFILVLHFLFKRFGLGVKSGGKDWYL